MNASPHPFAPYQHLVDRSREVALFHTGCELLQWDQETYMPPRGLAHRGELLACLTTTAHQRFTAPEVGQWIAACHEHGFPADSDEAANLREWHRAYHRATRLPADFVEAFERARNQGRATWQEARHHAEFGRFLPALTTLVELNRRKADLLGYSGSPYDALLDGFEPGTTTDELRTLFSELTAQLGPILQAAAARSAAIPEDLLDDDYPVPAQEAFNLEVVRAIGFDLDAGRIDTAVHPFCSGLGPGDCRLTTRCHPRRFTQSLFGILHEAGHGLYEQGLLPAHFGTPLGSFASLGIHESQSRLWENHVGRSPEFWEHWLPTACRHFPNLRRFNPDQITASVNRVAPSLIRVHADPVTYDFHIALRFDLEVRLLEGSLAPRDVPAAWNEQCDRLLGLRVPDDAQGCLQDIHWSLGELGYFPTYALGNLNAAQLMHQARKDLPGLEADLRQGQYGPLLQWLRRHIHAPGLRYPPQELIRRATGQTTSSQFHLHYLHQRHGIASPQARV